MAAQATPVAATANATPAQRVTGDSNVTSNTSSSAQQPAAKFTRASKRNPLSAYRSYNYVFTFAGMPDSGLTDPSVYESSTNLFVIAKSSGKGSKGIQVPAGASPDAASVVQGFNKNSPGRFDFYLNNVKIETIIGGEEAGQSLATKVEFEVFEPYSMTGFIEALQAAAKATGHDGYNQAHFLLKMEFFGYPDGDGIPSDELIPDTTRNFILTITGLEVDVTPDGTKYKVSAVPSPEKTFGEASVLKANIKAKGLTVEEVCNDLISQLNDVKKSQTSREEGATSNKHDEYEIVFPSVTSKGYDFGSKNDIASAKLGEILKTNNLYSMPDPGTDKKADPTSPVIQFSKNANIHELLMSIVRDSTYTQDIIKDLDSKTDSQGMVDYFIVNVEMEPKKDFDKSTGKPYYKYRFIVAPYKIHKTRIHPRPTGTVDTTELKKAVNREYNYFYTGANTDILSFNLKFNNLFFAAIPPAMGNQLGSGNDNRVEADNESKTTIQKQESSGSAVGDATRQSSGTRNTIIRNGQPNAGPPQASSYADLAKNMHQAILENVDQCQAEIEILGDPYYLVTGGNNGKRLPINPDGTAGEGEAPAATSQINILITFQNPIDIDPVTGEAQFDQSVALYSGIFWVQGLDSQFTDGAFKQKLKLIRIPGQFEDTKKPAQNKQLSIIEAVPDPDKQTTPTPAAPLSSVRASVNNLAASIAKGLPITGLPGALSNLIPGALGSIAGAVPGVSSIGSLINAVPGLSSGATSVVGSLVNQLSGNVQQGLSNVSSSIRLAAAGLSPLSSNINSAGGSVNQLAATANSIGLTSVTPSNLGQTVLASGAGTTANLGSSAMSAVGNLSGNAAGLVSQVSAKVSGLTGNSAALASQLGIDTSALSGLSPGVQSNLIKTISNAAASLPANVDMNAAVSKGLLLNNIPVSSFKNIPASMPDVKAPAAAVNLADIKNILKQGGSLSNLPFASTIPGIDSLAKSNSLGAASNLASSGLDAGTVAGKLATLQSGLSGVTGNSLSVEAGLNNISAAVPSGLPNVSNVASSVASKFGSNSSNAPSPLTALLQSGG